MHFYLTDQPRGLDGFLYVTTASEWERWVNASIPADIQGLQRSHLESNLKHILCGLEMKAGLLEAHFCLPKPRQRNCLFESYAAIMTFEFNVGVYSLTEGLGSAMCIADGRTKLNRAKWSVKLADCVATHLSSFSEDLAAVQQTRDRIHQDQAGNRGEIDWHRFQRSVGLLPAARVLGAIFREFSNHLPVNSNLIAFDARILESTV